MSLQTLFAPLPALVDREEPPRRMQVTASSLAATFGLPLTIPRHYWSRNCDDEASPSSSGEPSSASYPCTSYQQSAASSASASPLSLSLSPATPPVAGIAYSPSSGPSIDLNSLIPLESFTSDAFGPGADDWALFPSVTASDWSTFGNASLFHEASYASSSATTSPGSTSPACFLLPLQSTAGEASPISAPAPLPAGRHKTRAPTARAQAADGTAAKKECFHCHATSTPLWRREPVTQRPLCNACGLYLQQRNKLRPQALIDADRDDSDDEINRIPDSEYTGPRCSHCNTRQTSVWRRNKEGRQVCNACGVYQRLRGKERPLSLKRNKVKPRTKHIRAEPLAATVP
ncbi:GATA zinc finger domain-containing protein [Mycena chlorophos]|uniref:GATA zinc finger domain-containing protein n=1 Tax=Mycena chlorophos TaxID=658473 RepID=A0A8H6SCB5_MYCCL|nr:GATA zinc finger domain-containing protein [Mycena chlorophos]